MKGYLWTFQYGGIKGFVDLQEVYRNIFLKNEQRHPFSKSWFYKHLGIGFTGFGVQMISLWICKVGYTWRNRPLFEVVQKVLVKMFKN